MINPKSTTASVIDAASKFAQVGWYSIPIPLGQKRPVLPGWQTKRFTAQEIPSVFGPSPVNIGVLLGEPSANLVDVDLDSALALAVADEFFPETLTFGRLSKPRSHRLFVAAGVKTKRFPDPVSKECVLELRSTGAQTVFPPSTHVSGERIEWAGGNGPVSVAADDLCWRAACAASAAVLAAHWPTQGSRHEAGLALAGGLLLGGIPANMVERIIRAAASAAKDEELEDRVSSVASTAARIAASENVTGMKRLADFVDTKVVQKISEWLGLKGGAARRSENGNDGINAVRDAGASAASASDVCARLSSKGTFYKTKDGAYFVEKDGGRTVPATSGGPFESLVTAAAGRVRGSLRALVAEVVGEALTKAKHAAVCHVTARDEGTAVFVDLGSGNIVRCDARGACAIEFNGANGRLFLPERRFAPLDLKKLRAAAGRSSPGLLFPVLREVVLDHLPPPAGQLSCLEQQALVLAMWLGSFLAPWARAKPMGLFVGEKATGKSVTQRLISKTFYGPSGDTAGGVMLDRVMKDLAASACEKALVIRDDMNQMPRGAQDALCRLSTGTTFELADFNKTLELVDYEARAQILLSATTTTKPDWFYREDLMDRCLVVELAPCAPTTITEEDRARQVLDNREAIWAETLAALRHLVLSVPARTPVTRFGDWERALAPIMERAGYGAAFDSALKKMPAVRAGLVARSDPIIGAILEIAYAEPGLWESGWTAAQVLDSVLASFGVSAHPRELHRATAIIRDPLRMGQFLAKLEQDGGGVLEIKSRPGHNNTKLWRIRPRFSRASTLGGGDASNAGARACAQEPEPVPTLE